MFALATQAAAATKQDHSEGTKRHATKIRLVEEPLRARLAVRVDEARKHRGTIRFFERRPWLLRSERQGRRSRSALRRAERLLVVTSGRIAGIRHLLHRRQVRRLTAMRPKVAICDVFGRYCRQAVAVAWCESRLSTTARNGQYLGLFQMGSFERRLFGFGRTARQQAAAAHRYFVHSGRDWSPWSCKPWYAY